MQVRDFRFTTLEMSIEDLRNWKAFIINQNIEFKQSSTDHSHFPKHYQTVLRKEIEFLDEAIEDRQVLTKKEMIK